MMTEDMIQDMHCWQYAKFFNSCYYRQKILTLFLIVSLTILKKLLPPV